VYPNTILGSLNHLNWHEQFHIRNLNSTAFGKVHELWLMFKTKTSDIKQISIKRVEWEKFWKYFFRRSYNTFSSQKCIQLWGMASDSNVMKVKRVQNRALRIIADAPWYIRNDALTTDLNVPSVREQINRHSSRYNDRLTAHINHLAASLAHPRIRRRLMRRHPGDLWTRGRQVSRVLKQ